MSNIESHETVIIGAGPAGLQLAYFLEKAGRDYLVLEAADRAGAFFESFPRHRTLISINKVHTTHSEPDFRLRHDWNSIISDAEDLRFTRYSKEYFPPADTFVRYCADFAEHFRLKIRYGTRVARVTRDASGAFELACGDTVVRAKRLVVATG